MAQAATTTGAASGAVDAGINWSTVYEPPTYRRTAWDAMGPKGEVADDKKPGEYEVGKEIDRLTGCPRVLTPTEVGKTLSYTKKTKRFCTLFAGTGRLAASYAEQGYLAEGWDILDGSAADITRPRVYRRIRRNIKEKRYFAMSIDFPCNTFSKSTQKRR